MYSQYHILQLGHKYYIFYDIQFLFLVESIHTILYDRFLFYYRKQ